MALSANKQDLGLKVLSYLQSSGFDYASLDIIAIHGLDGHRIKSWTYQSSATGEETFWLQDLLPKYIPGARVMTFGYDATVHGSTSVAGIRDNAQTLLARLIDQREDEAEMRPLIFIGHNLGGIVIKYALRFAQNEKRYRSVAEATCGIIFFGTPHRGTNIEFWTTVTKNIAGTCKPFGRKMKPVGGMAKEIQKNSETLKNISEDFRSIVSNLGIVSFYETDKMEWLDSVVVAKDSALMEIPDEDYLYISGNHLQICQFDNEDLDRFEQVWKRIKRLSERSPKAATLTDEEQVCLNSLCGREIHDYRNIHVPRRTPNTCTWVIKRPEYQSWLEANNSGLLWVLGAPGCGKTVLASFIVDNIALQLNGREPTRAVVANFFCNARRPDRNNASAILRATLHQMLQGRRWIIRKHALSIYQSRSREKTVWTLDVLRSLFQDVISDLRVPVYLILDGFDECEETSQGPFLDTIKLALNRETSATSFKVLLVSRLQPRLLDKLDEYLRMEIRTNDVRDDIQATVILRAQALALKHDYPPDVQTRICNDVSKGADGMHLWAALMMDDLHITAPTRLRVLKRLQSLPDGILELYDQILGNVQGNKTRVKDILSCVLYAFRPLNLAELSIAMALRDHKASSWECLEKDISFNIESEINRYCGQLIRISGNTAGLVHRSLEEFLISTTDSFSNDKLTSHPSYYIPPVLGHSKLTEVCIAYLLLDDFGKISETTGSNRTAWLKKVQARISKYSFVAYAAQYWMHHYANSEPTNDYLKPQIEELNLPGGTKRISWTEVVWFLLYPRKEFLHNSTILYGSSFDLQEGTRPTTSPISGRNYKPVLTGVSRSTMPMKIPESAPRMTSSGDLPSGNSIAATNWPNWNYRVYFQDSLNRIQEVSHKYGIWSSLTGHTGIVDAKPHTQLATISRRSGNEIRIYYITNENFVYEQCFFEGRGWFSGTLNTCKIMASAYSRLAVTSWPTGIRIYYQAINNNIQEYICADDGYTWTKGDILSNALTGSSLAATSWIGLRGLRIHVYYQDKDLKLKELLWDGSWNNGTLPPTEAPPYTPIAALSWYLNDVHLCVYWRSTSGQVFYHTWAGRWSVREEGIPSSAPLSKNTGLAVVEWNHGCHKRVYFMKELDVIEECWSGGKWFSGGRIA